MVNTTPIMSAMSVLGVRRGKAAFFSGCKFHPVIAPSGSNRSSHGGDEMAEAFSMACHELVSRDFRCGSTTDSRALLQPRPELGVERTKSGPKQTSPHKGRLGALPANGLRGSWWRCPLFEALSCGRDRVRWPYPLAVF